MPDQNTPPDVNSAQQRHWFYGFNAALLVIVGVMILAFLMAAVERTRGKTQWDMTSNGVNSLSGSTKKLLNDINDHQQNFHIVSLFTDPSNEEKTKGDPNRQAEKRAQIMDMLNLYSKNSSHIQVDDWGDKARDDIEKEIRDKYASELKPYEDVVKHFDELAKKLREFADYEAQAVSSAMQKANATPEDQERAGGLQSQFRQLPSMIEDLQEDIHHETSSTLPDWKQLSDGIKQLVDNLEARISMLADPAKVKQLSMPASLTAYFTEANPRYKAMASDLTKYLDELNKLKALKVQEVLSGVGRNTVVVLGPDQAKVLHTWDIYADAPNQDASGAPLQTFKGEEQISSSLLAMARPEKVKVVYVTSAPQRLTSDMYSEFSKQLEQANFEVLEWSPPGPTAQDESAAAPPAEGKGVVWIVFPPEMPTGQMAFLQPPTDPKPVIAAVRKHMDKGGQVMFLAESSGAAGPLGGSDKYAYDELLTSFGIAVKPKYTAVDVTTVQNPTTGAIVTRFKPFVDLDTYEDHPITAPIQTFPMAFFPAEKVTVVDVVKPAPGGADPKVIVKTPNSDEYWGETDFAGEPKFDPQNDLRAPIPLAAVSTIKKGTPEEQRVVVVGCKYIAADPVLNATQPAVVGNQIVQFRLFPGNQEFTKNAILWLAGYENMIAVSANANAQSRFNVTTNGLVMLRVIAIVVAPLAVLLLGVFIWVIRHR